MLIVTSIHVMPYALIQDVTQVIAEIAAAHETRLARKPLGVSSREDGTQDKQTAAVRWVTCSAEVSFGPRPHRHRHHCIQDSTQGRCITQYSGWHARKHHTKRSPDALLCCWQDLQVAKASAACALTEANTQIRAAHDMILGQLLAADMVWHIHMVLSAHTMSAMQRHLIPHIVVTVQCMLLQPHLTSSSFCWAALSAYASPRLRSCMISTASPTQRHTSSLCFTNLSICAQRKDHHLRI